MKSSITSLSLIFLFSLQNLYAQNITSTFDVDDEGWLVVGDATSSIPQYHADGGNEGGYISADDTANGGVWYWSAPEKFTGDQSASFGKNLSFDLAQNNLDSQFDADDILILGENLTLALDLPVNPGINWTSYSVKLDTSENWMIETYLSGNEATEADIQEVLTNVTAIRIRGEFVSGPDVGSLDNVILESASMSVSSFEENNLKVYPNPTSGKFFLSKEVKELTVYQLNGQKMQTFYNTKLVDATHLPAGIYLLKILQTDGKLFETKLMKK